MSAREVFVRGLPELPSLQDFIVQYFQNESCGGPVSHVSLLGPGQAVVTFVNESVAQNVLAHPQHLFHGSRLQVGPWSRHLSDDEIEEDEGGLVQTDDVSENLVPGGQADADQYGDLKQAVATNSVVIRVASTRSRHGDDRLPRSSGLVGAVSRPKAAKPATQQRESSLPPTETTVMRVDIVEGCAKLLLQYHGDVMREVEQSFSVRVKPDSAGFSVSGTSEGVSEAKVFLENVAASVKTDVLQSFKPGQTELHIRDVIVQVQMGDITMEQVGAIVNPSQNNLDMDKGVSRAISMAAGPGVQRECRQYIRDNWSPKAGDVVATGAGDLPCGKVIHLVQPSAKYLRSDIKNCLLVAHQMNLRSITFPAVGTGGFHIKPERSARCMMDGIAEFVEDWSPTTLSIIRIVIFQERMLQTFHTAVHGKASEDRGKVTPSKHANRLNRLKNIAADKMKRMRRRPKEETLSSTSLRLPRPDSPGKFEDALQPDEVLLHIFCLDETKLQNARETVEGFLQQYTTVVVINDDRETGISQLVKEEIKWLRFLGREENVSISVEQENCIRIEGSRNVTAIAAKVRLILKTIVEKRGRFARMMSSENYQW
ncbi:PREDICTED: poly [ADP-ribose] polymerase 14-like [Branchiostoma belcheri]|uniref:Poly [ADP-ribose] polymerase 14-like n=1 Tax=Branchiostoma belcheri TaxID=7741 RepID=A0A6P5AJ20_BRABE|nr:PREDICTED: poly [ADP-ribose] polymerase 14-like [Branchiostoma belcheri]